MEFTDRLMQKVHHIWEETHKHPFITGMGDGTLPVESFKNYMKQDYVYLIEYSKLFALGTVKATDLETMTKFAQILHETLSVEMGLHRSYAEKFAISNKELEETKATPVNIAYTSYMLQAAQKGSLAELVAVLLPCMWGYWEIGKLLVSEYPESINHPLYGEWVSMYSSDEFGRLASWLMELMNTLAVGKQEAELKILEEHFITTSRFEYMFWDMVYRGDDWPV